MNWNYVLSPPFLFLLWTVDDVIPHDLEQTCWDIRDNLNRCVSSGLSALMGDDRRQVPVRKRAGCRTLQKADLSGEDPEPATSVTSLPARPNRKPASAKQKKGKLKLKGSKTKRKKEKRKKKAKRSKKEKSDKQKKTNK